MKVQNSALDKHKMCFSISIAFAYLNLLSIFISVNAVAKDQAAVTVLYILLNGNTLHFKLIDLAMLFYK